MSLLVSDYVMRRLKIISLLQTPAYSTLYQRSSERLFDNRFITSYDKGDTKTPTAKIITWLLSVQLFLSEVTPDEGSCFRYIFSPLPLTLTFLPSALCATETHALQTTIPSSTLQYAMLFMLKTLYFSCSLSNYAMLCVFLSE